MITRKSTKELLVESVLELMEAKPVNRITIRNITENCGMSRHAFYYYFKDKHELINYVFKRDVDSVLQQNSGRTPWKVLLGDMLVNMKQKRRFYRMAMDDDSQNSFRNYILEYNIFAYMKEVERRVAEAPLSEEVVYAIRFNGYGAAGIILEWIGEGMTEDPYHVAELIAKNMPEGMKVYFE